MEERVPREAVERLLEAWRSRRSATSLRAARPHATGAIVIGSRGLGTVAGALLGSVSKVVVRDADRPVLVARSGAGARSRLATIA